MDAKGMKRKKITDKHMYRVGIFLRPTVEAARDFLSGFYLYTSEKQTWNRTIYATQIEDLSPLVRKKVILDNDGILIGDITSIKAILGMGVPAIVLPC